MHVPFQALYHKRPSTEQTANIVILCFFMLLEIEAAYP